MLGFSLGVQPQQFVWTQIGWIHGGEVNVDWSFSYLVKNRPCFDGWKAQGWIKGWCFPIISWLNYLCELMLFSKFGPSKNERFLLNEEKTHFMYCGLFSLLYVTTATTARKGYSLGIIRKCVHINDWCNNNSQYFNLFQEAVVVREHGASQEMSLMLILPLLISMILIMILMVR